MKTATITSKFSRAKILFLALCAIGAFTMAGCRYEAFKYDESVTKGIVKKRTPATQETLYVDVFKDHRRGVNRNHALIALIPFVPVAGADTPFPDEGYYKTDVPYDLTDATVFSFKNSRAFPNTVRKDIPLSKAGYTLSGDIYDFGSKHYFISYGLSLYASLAWIIALPDGTSTNRIDVELTLRDNTTGVKIWSERLREKSTFVRGLYYNFKMNSRFPRLYAQIMDRAINHASSAVVQYERELHTRATQRTTTSLQKKHTLHNDYPATEPAQ